MRLTPSEIESIKSVTSEVFGTGAQVMLFGSRTDDQSRGGDIDLLIRLNESLPRPVIYQRKLTWLVKLKKLIGDQKIDLLISVDEKRDRVMESAASNAILL